MRNTGVYSSSPTLASPSAAVQAQRQQQQTAGPGRPISQVNKWITVHLPVLLPESPWQRGGGAGGGRVFTSYTSFHPMIHKKIFFSTLLCHNVLHTISDLNTPSKKTTTQERYLQRFRMLTGKNPPPPPPSCAAAGQSRSSTELSRSITLIFQCHRNIRGGLGTANSNVSEPFPETYTAGPGLFH